VDAVRLLPADSGYSRSRALAIECVSSVDTIAGVANL
jgi:hypothetical protein